MPLNSRDTTILWTTIALAVVAALWFFGVSPLYDDWAQTEAQLATQRSDFDKNVTVLRDRARIEGEYERIRQAIPTESQDATTAEFAFTENVNALTEAILKRRPSLGTIDLEPLKEVRGFTLLNLPMNTTGKLEDITRLLKAFDQQGYLLQKVELTARDLDSPELTLSVVVSRVVQIQEETARPTRGTRRSS